MKKIVQPTANEDPAAKARIRNAAFRLRETSSPTFLLKPAIRALSSSIPHRSRIRWFMKMLSGPHRISWQVHGQAGRLSCGIFC